MYGLKPVLFKQELSVILDDEQLVRHFQYGPGVFGIEVINGAAFDDRIGQGVVVEPRGVKDEASLGLANLLGRGGVDALVETENAGGIVRLKALGFRRGGEHEKTGWGAGKEDQQGDCSPLRAKNRPIGGAGALQAGVDDVFRAMRLVSLRNEAAALGEQCDESLGNAGE